jgi:hypothetical protein
MVLNNLKSKFYLIILFYSIFTLIGFIFHLNNTYLSKKSEQHKQINNECLSEWALLNQDIYFRRNLAFYYTDLQVIRLYFERKNPSNHSLSLLYLTLYRSNKQYNGYLHATDSKIINNRDNFGKINIYSFEYIEFKFNSTTIEPLKVIVNNQNDDESTSFIDLIIKKFKNNNDSTNKKHSMLCTKAYHFNTDYFTTFKWWIEMNKMHGYSKLVIYNNSIETNNEMSEYFNENKDFVEIIQFKCIPNFVSDNRNQLFISDFYDLESRYKNRKNNVHMHFEIFTYNECYLQNMNNYKFITINDQDETIIPKYLKNYTKQEHDLIRNSDQFMQTAESFCYFNKMINKPKNQTNIQIYLNSLSEYMEYQDLNISYHFRMGLYMKPKTMDMIFNEIKKINFTTNNNSKTVVRVYDENEKNLENGGMKFLNFSISIETQQDYEYAKYLYDLYTKVYKPFLKKNKKTNQIPDSYDRLFLVLGPSTRSICGKTIHNTLLTEVLEHHYPKPVDKYLKYVPNKIGFTSHFRKDYKYFNVDKSIQEFKFDLNYFLCYFKPILNKFN